MKVSPILSKRIPENCGNNIAGRAVTAAQQRRSLSRSNESSHKAMKRCGPRFKDLVTVYALGSNYSNPEHVLYYV